MTVKLTDQLVRKLVADRGARRDIRDTQVPGLILRVGATKAVWVVRYTSGKTKRRLPLGRVEIVGLREARDRARQQLRAVEDGRDPVAEVRIDRERTFEALSEMYIERYAKVRKKSWRNDQRILTRHLLPIWGKRSVASIKRRDARDRIEAIKASAPVQANRVRALLSKLFGYALEHEWVEVNPLAGVKLPTRERARKRLLTMEEVATFWNTVEERERDGSIDSALADQFRLRLLLGQRGGEIASMRWDDIADGLWTQPDPKNGRSHVLPVSDALQDVLRRQRARVPVGTPWVFPDSTGNGPDIYRAWRGVELPGDGRKVPTKGLEAFGVANAKGHDLRRACATHMARLGVPPHLIGRLQNNGDALGKVASIYNRYSYLPELRAALATWADAVMCAAQQQRERCA